MSEKLSLRSKFKSIEEIELKDEQKKTEVVRNKVVGGKKGFRFDKKLHKYLLDGVELVSVTQLMDKFKDKFESNYIASMTANKHKRDGHNFLDTELKVKHYWDALGERASSLGTSGHAFCQAYYLSNYTLEPLHEIERNAKKLMDAIRNKYDIVNMEESRGNRTYALGYTIDIELVDRMTGDYVLGDFKFSANFTAEQYKGNKGRQANLMNEPFKELGLRDVPKDKGEIQLNIYKKLYKDDTGIDPKYCILFHVDGLSGINYYEGEKGFWPYIVRDLSSTVDRILEPQKKYTVNLIDRA